MNNQDNQNPNPDQNGQGGVVPTPGDQDNKGAQGVQGQPVGVYDELASKKGFKDRDSFAKSYTEAETELGRRQSALDKAKAGVEEQSKGTLTMDKEGNIVPTSQGGQQQPAQYGGQPQYGNQYGAQGVQGGYSQPQGQPLVDNMGNALYDQYTGMPITNQIELQLSQYPPYQRTAMIATSVMNQQREFESAAFKHDNEVLSRPEAKGFEDDVRKVMQGMQPQQRADKNNWENALLRVKGARYDQDKQNWGQNSVDNFINKADNQPMAGAGSGGSGVKLSQSQEATFQHYMKNYPGMFKDRVDFAKSLRKDGGR